MDWLLSRNKIDLCNGNDIVSFDEFDDKIISEFHEEKVDDNSDSFVQTDDSGGESVSEEELDLFLKSFCSEPLQLLAREEDTGTLTKNENNNRHQIREEQDINDSEYSYLLDDHEADAIFDESEESDSYTSLDDEKLYEKFLHEHAKFQKTRNLPNVSHDSSSSFNFGIKTDRQTFESLEDLSIQSRKNCEVIVDKNNQNNDSKYLRSTSISSSVDYDTSSVTLPESPVREITDDVLPEQPELSIGKQGCEKLSTPVNHDSKSCNSSVETYPPKPQSNSYLSKTSIDVDGKQMISKNKYSEYSYRSGIETSSVSISTPSQLNFSHKNIPLRRETMNSIVNPFEYTNEKYACSDNEEIFYSDTFNISAIDKQKTKLRMPITERNLSPHSVKSDNTNPPSSATLRSASSNSSISRCYYSTSKKEDKRLSQHEEVVCRKDEYAKKLNESEINPDKHLIKCLTIGILETSIDDGFTKVIPVQVKMQNERSQETVSPSEQQVSSKLEGKPDSPSELFKCNETFLIKDYASNNFFSKDTVSDTSRQNTWSFTSVTSLIEDTDRLPKLLKSELNPSQIESQNTSLHFDIEQIKTDDLEKCILPSEEKTSGFINLTSNCSTDDITRVTECTSSSLNIDGIDSQATKCSHNSTNITTSESTIRTSTSIWESDKDIHQKSSNNQLQGIGTSSLPFTHVLNNRSPTTSNDESTVTESMFGYCSGNSNTSSNKISDSNSENFATTMSSDSRYCLNKPVTSESDNKSPSSRNSFDSQSTFRHAGIIDEDKNEFKKLNKLICEFKVGCENNKSFNINELNGKMTAVTCLLQNLLGSSSSFEIPSDVELKLTSIDSSSNLTDQTSVSSRHPTESEFSQRKELISVSGDSATIESKSNQSLSYSDDDFEEKQLQDDTTSSSESPQSVGFENPIILDNRNDHNIQGDKVPRRGSPRPRGRGPLRSRGRGPPGPRPRGPPGPRGRGAPGPRGRGPPESRGRGSPGPRQRGPSGEKGESPPRPVNKKPPQSQNKNPASNEMTNGKVTGSSQDNPNPEGSLFDGLKGLEQSNMPVDEHDYALGSDTHENNINIVEQILNVDEFVNLNVKTTSNNSTIQNIDGSVLGPNMDIAQISYTQPLIPGKDTFYWVPREFKDYLHISDHPLVSDYFPRISDTQFCCVMIREFVHVHFYLKLHPDSRSCYAKYNILIWDKDKSPVTHFRSQCPVRLDSGSAHHVATLSEVAMMELLAQDIIVVSCQVTNFSKWEPGMKDKEAPWFLSNGPHRPRGQHEMDKLFNNERYADVTLLSNDGEKFPAHRAVICGESAILKSQIDTSDESTITVNIRGSILQQILYSFYTGEMPPHSQTITQTNREDRWRDILEILVASVRIEAPRLERKCAAWLATSLDRHNACSIYTVATRLNLESLAFSCREYIKNHRKGVINSPDWLTLKNSPMAVADLLMNTDIYRHQPPPTAVELCTRPDFHNLNDDIYYPSTAKYTASPDDILNEYGFSSIR